jgi:hypothetical protein
MTGKVGNPDRVHDLHRLAEIWQGLGLRVKEMDGWEKRGHSSNITFDVLGCHHTAVPKDNDRILRDGDSTLEGPRCNVALHLNGDVVLVASGLAFHFGCATWPNGRSLGVEATGPQTTGPKFPNRDAYVALAAGFCIFKGNADPRKVVKSDVGIPVHLVAAHKEVAVGRFIDGKLVCNEQTRKRYGRKTDPDFDEPGRILKGALAHGFSAPNGVRLIDTFRNDVHALITAKGAAPGQAEEDDMTTDQLLDALESPRGKAILRGIVALELATVIRGDKDTPDGGTHPHNLRSINLTVKEIKDKLPG